MQGEGRSLVAMLYTYRGISRAIPQVLNQEDPNKQAIYENQLRVLAPEIEKLKRLMTFTQKAVALFARQAGAVAAAVLPPTPWLLGKMADVLDTLSLLDTLKNMKACLNNDFSFYKRAFGFLKRNLAPDEEAFNQMLHLFLANPSSISTSLKAELVKIANVEEVLLLLIHHCEDAVSSERFVLPNERFALLRVIPYVMFLLDNDSCNVFKDKRINWDRIKGLFKDNPVVPLYGDMQTTLDHVLAQAPNFRSSNWESFDPTRADPKVANKYLIVRNMERYRTQYRQFLAAWQTATNSTRLTRARPDAARTYQTAMTGLTLLSAWTSDVLAQTAWKYASPNTSAKGEDIADYERVVRLNYEPAELTALVELISFIKSLAGVLLAAEADVDALLKSVVHDEVQTFVQTQLRHVIGVVTVKKKKEGASIRPMLLAVRAITADWAQGTEPNDTVISGGEKRKMTIRSKKDEASDVPDISHRAVGPNLGQLVILRSTLWGLLCENYYKGVVEKKRWAKLTKDLSAQDVLKGEYEKACQVRQRSVNMRACFCRLT